MGNGSYQLISAGQSANHGQLGQHWLAGNFYFPCGRIFIFCFSEPLGINSEVLNSLLLGKGLFIQIYFGGLWKAYGTLSNSEELKKLQNITLKQKAH